MFKNYKNNNSSDFKKLFSSLLTHISHLGHLTAFLQITIQPANSCQIQLSGTLNAVERLQISDLMPNHKQYANKNISYVQWPVSQSVTSLHIQSPSYTMHACTEQNTSLTVNSGSLVFLMVSSMKVVITSLTWFRSLAQDS